jgi:16S rRNA (guanine966-N2)-methyltransferase
MSLRVIGGDLKGKRLHTIPGKIIRPTADRLRESIFNILAFCVRGKVVLDLFAGTGALGIEALSRGAVFSTFIDQHKEAISVISRNINTCGLEGRTRIIKWNAIRNLNCIQSIHPAFNLVFMDPPYNENFLRPVLSNLYRSNCLEKGAVIIVEHSHLEPIPNDFRELAISDQRRYGKTLVSFLDYQAPSNHHNVLTEDGEE